MKQIVWLLPCVLLSTNVLAQQASTNAPAAKPSRPAIVEPPVSLSPGPATVAANNLNVRGQATIHSESITQLNAGDTVTVLEQINLDKFQPDEPRQWARIAFPDKADVWVHTSFIDRNTMTVTAPELNVRAGPGENYSVVGTITQGTQVREVLTDGHWMRIAAPPGTYAFVAAMYLQQEAPATTVPAVASGPTIEMPQPETNPTIPTNEVPTNEAATTTADATAAVAVAATTNAESAATSAADMMTVGSPTLLPAEPSSATQPPPVSEPPPPRVVTHEGVVKTTVSIQAPTPYALVNPETGRTVNYLLSPTTNLDLALYKGLRIVVNGEEGLDSRWTNTPVITIKRIHVVE